MQRAIDFTHITTIIVDVNGVCDETGRLQARPNDFQHTPENPKSETPPESEVPWLKWPIGGRLRTTRAIPAHHNGELIGIGVDTYLWVRRTNRRYVLVSNHRGDRIVIADSNCRYLELDSCTSLTEAMAICDLQDGR